MLIDDRTSNDVLFPPSHPCKTIPRDYNVQPQSVFAPPSSVQIIPRSEWDARIDEQEARQSSLEHIAKQAGLEVLDQNGQGYCWAYSTTMSVMLQRLAAGLGKVRLSAHAVACKVKNFRDEGGWAALSQEYIRAHGVPDVQHWQEKSMNRANDTAATWENAASFKITEDVVDLTRDVYDRNLQIDIIATLLLQNRPVPTDWAFWGHSVCAARLVRIERGRYGFRIANSWAPSWGDRGWGTIDFQAKGAPMGAVGTISTAA